MQCCTQMVQCIVEISQVEVTVRRNGRVVAEQNGAYGSTSSSMKMEVTAITEALRWLSAPVTREIIVTESQSVLCKMQNSPS